MSGRQVGDDLLRRRMAIAAYKIRKLPFREREAQARACLDAIRQYLGVQSDRSDRSVDRVDSRERDGQ